MKIYCINRKLSLQCTRRYSESDCAKERNDRRKQESAVRDEEDRRESGRTKQEIIAGEKEKRLCPEPTLAVPGTAFMYLFLQAP